MIHNHRCPACGHWCVPYDDDTEPGWICSKRGGCGSEWPESADSEWAIYQFYPGLPAEGDSPEIADESPELLERGFATQAEADSAVDASYGNRFNVGTVQLR